MNITIPQIISEEGESDPRLTFRLTAEYERTREGLYYELCDYVEMSEHDLANAMDFNRVSIQKVTDLLTEAMRAGYHPIHTMPDLEEEGPIRVTSLSCEPHEAGLEAGIE